MSKRLLGLAGFTWKREEQDQPRGEIVLSVPEAMTKGSSHTSDTLPRGQRGHQRVPGRPRSAHTSRGGPEPQAPQALTPQPRGASAGRAAR